MDDLIHFGDEATLLRALLKSGFDHFAEKTDIARQLSGQSLYPVGVNMTIELALADYDAKLGNPMVSRLMRMRKKDLIQCLAPDYPDLVQTIEGK